MFSNIFRKILQLRRSMHHLRDILRYSTLREKNFLQVILMQLIYHMVLYIKIKVCISNEKMWFKLENMFAVFIVNDLKKNQIIYFLIHQINNSDEKLIEYEKWVLYMRDEQHEKLLGITISSGFESSPFHYAKLILKSTSLILH